MPVLLPSPDLFIDFASKPAICTLFKNFTPYPSDRLAPPLASNSFSILPLPVSLQPRKRVLNASLPAKPAEIYCHKTTTLSEDNFRFPQASGP
ncbi:hypothetical protein Q8A67_022486 [Cirrhinus molitorella]|uniref:Uncharacterized protein n=1 Tax=Cirrhinus molitorella TaxID=172907 RepID=A0AA88P853_9TELE|nr:hypothetical protein Q8A67_022486 [Cirrhinus molitorella]